MRVFHLIFVFFLCSALMVAQQVPAPPAGVTEVKQAQLELLPSSPKVIYPAGASMDSVQGQVVLGVTISPEGKVEQVDILEGSDMLAKPTAKTVAKWTFHPHLDSAGRPERVYSKFTFNFAFRNRIKDTCKDTAPGPASSTAAPVDPASLPQRVRVSQTVSQGLLCFQVAPAYPPEARQNRISGSVVLKAIIGREGTLKEMQVVSGQPLLADAATAAVRQWRYHPYKLNGRPVEVETQITVNFTLSP